ncbi:MAG: PRC-barrel domain-containing protein [Candidatus Rokuibacteriota bacterium]
MLRTVTDYRRYAIAATDGEIGRVDDVLFDDRTWTVRYLVVDTGSWLTGRRVLLSPASVSDADPSGERFRVPLTRRQVEESPPVEADRPVSRQHEIQLADHYGYPYYWAGPYRWGPAPYPLVPMAVPPQPDPVEREIRERQRQSADPNLRSAREVTGYGIEATDGEIGHLEDFLVDDRAWAIRYVIVDTRNWWPGKKVVISPEWVAGVSWNDQTVRVDLSREQVRGAPEYDPSAPVARDYETRLHDHYRRSRYWEIEPGRAA